MPSVHRLALNHGELSARFQHCMLDLLHVLDIVKASSRTQDVFLIDAFLGGDVLDHPSVAYQDHGSTVEHLPAQISTVHCAECNWLRCRGVGYVRAVIRSLTWAGYPA